MGSDRSNIAELLSLRSSYPLPYDKFTSTFLDNADCKWPLERTTVSATDAKIILASGGYYSGEKAPQGQQAGNQIMNADNTKNNNRNENLNPLLDNAAASFRQGLICCPQKAGTYNLVSTRNNNFTNRSQKMHIVVKPANGAQQSQAQKWEFYPSASTRNTDRTNAEIARK